MARGKQIPEMDKAYICKFYEIDGPSSIAAALNRNLAVVKETYYRIQRQGELEHYIKLWDKQFEDVEVSAWF